ncbi:MAG: ester cyclase [Actinomycetota bacterium]|nr:ester cyclase [Actinomycetota bacterium]
MAAQDNAATARRLPEAWNERDFDSMAMAMADDGEIVVVGSDQRFVGRDGVREFARMWADAFPDGRVEVTNVIDGGDHVAVEYTGRGTQTGTLVSAAGEIPPTGRSIELRLCDIVQFRDGKVTTIRSYFDSASLMAQLGLMPEPAGATA